MHWPYITYAFRNVSFDIWCTIFQRDWKVYFSTEALLVMRTAVFIIPFKQLTNRADILFFIRALRSLQVHSGRPTPVKYLIYSSAASHCAECRQSLPFQMSVPDAQRASHEPTVNNSGQPSVGLLTVPYTRNPQVFASAAPCAAATSSIHN